MPSFHPFASENDDIAWRFFVRHYANDEMQRRDPAYREFWRDRRVDGVLYPRASCLGGCTAHNAMIFVAPPAADWDQIANLTDDASWSSANMARYFSRVENCHHRWAWRVLAKIGINRTGHGFGGWLHTEKALPRQAFEDRDLVKVVARSAHAVLGGLSRVKAWLRLLLHSFGDPNDNCVIETGAEGLFYTPLSTRRHRRHGARERVLSVARKWPQLLDVRLNAFATRVVLDNNNRAVGVEYMRGTGLYGAHANASAPPSELAVIRARKEIILAAGAFNTPQLLMLSGIGPPEVLDQHRIAVKVALNGIGTNLQDRYEVGVINRMAFGTWPSLKGAQFRRSDPQYRTWSLLRRGMYISNGATLTVAKRSDDGKACQTYFAWGC